MYATARLLLLIGVFVSQLGCHPANFSPEDLTAYVNDSANGLCQTQRTGKTQVSVTYQPADILVTRELQAEENNPSVTDSLRAKYRHSTYFLLSISRNGREALQPGEGFARYSELLQTLSFRMDNYIRLVTSRGDTLRPVNYYLDRTYAAGSASQLLFAFPAVPITGTWQFHLLECGLGTGSMSFAFDTEAIREVPALTVH